MMESPPMSESIDPSANRRKKSGFFQLICIFNKASSTADRRYRIDAFLPEPSLTAGNSPFVVMSLTFRSEI